MSKHTRKKTGREPNRVDKLVGANLCDFRKSNKMSQTALGTKVGVTYQQIQKYERGENRIGASRLWAFCEVLHKSPSDFFEGVQKDKNKNAMKQSNEVDLLQHPRGRELAQAFLKIEDSGIENKIVSVCQFWSQ